ncbi:sensory box histidine kinase/response regulator [Legionella birminghamensis]|uniref:Sensory box histidine kinase/response regulator n=1 Tax=Legionella birminghamensis TaxID=28083 RepID=A0A378IEQ7_9GAMM|nr:response regulator [Legionella birminghamensis]KTC73778.1 sensory box histidine kinase/response regulator [Legionella birminghamensis]STX30724.1 sensory box histidine kinase/response regulator [Legionella birminghamensis]
MPIPFILLVEDNLIALTTIQSLAKQSQCRWLSADNAERAFSLATEHEFDLIITDLGLPDFSGLELTKKIREWEVANGKPSVPIIGLTVHAMNEEALSAGMNDLLIKPLSLADFQKLLADYLTE